MVSYAVLPHIGAVGAKLLYANGSVQHAGVIVGVGGIANHAFQFYQGGDIGYQNRLQLPQYFLAVTAACMVVEKEKYQKCGGLDDKDLKVAYNDVDFCLRLSRDLGLKNVYTPYAQLFHHESVSRGQDISPEKVARFEHESMTMRKRWGDIMQRDPYYNENFSHHNAYFQYKYE
jgi:GT2 family glycosyltransferase